MLGSIGVSAALSKSALLAGPALLYPIWGPWVRAGVRNAELYLRQFKSLGLWRAQARGCGVTGGGPAFFGVAPGSQPLRSKLNDGGRVRSAGVSLCGR